MNMHFLKYLYIFYMKKSYSILFSFIVGGVLPAFAAWNGDAQIWTNGDGSEANPYLIENEANLAYLQSAVTKDESFQGKFFRLTANLDMSGKEFKPIGRFDDYTTQDNPEMTYNSFVFKGTFDGDYHKIDNMVINDQNADQDLGGVGLFAVAYAETTIKNLIIGSNVTVASSLSCTGAIIGYASGGRVENCLTSATVKGGSFDTGGIIGLGENITILGCANRGLVEGHTNSGGIAGHACKSTISNCYSTGKLACAGAFLVAGIVGWAEQSTLSNCYATGEVEAQEGSASFAGKSPVCADLERSTASNCYYVKELTGCEPKRAQAGVEAVSEADLKSADMIAKLNAGLDAPAWVQVDGGFPALAWESEKLSAISEVLANEGGLSVEKAGSALVVRSASASEVGVSVYTLDGKAVLLVKATDGEAIPVDAKGAVVVTAVAADGARAIAKYVF